MSKMVSDSNLQEFGTKLKSKLATVATSGSYSDLSNKPTIPSAPGTLNTNNTTAQTASSSEALSGTIKLHKVSKTGSYTDLLNKPSIPTVNNSTVTIQMNGSSVGSFTTNQASAGTINLGSVLTSHQSISGKEDVANKVTALNTSTVQYPTCSAVSAGINSAISNIDSEVWTFELEDGTTVTKTVLLG